MDANLEKVMNAKIKRTMKALESNGYKVCFAETKDEALKLVKELVPAGSTTSVGGSMTLFECGIIDYLKNNTDYLDRYVKGLSYDDLRETFRKALMANYYLTSANAITEHGEIYNVDNTGNRAAAIAYGPDNVIFVVGMNKVVPTLKDAVVRVKRTACPANTQRLGVQTFCVKAGVCIKPTCDLDQLMCGADCGDNTLCRRTLIMSRVKDNRYTVILVGEDVGY